MTGDNQHRLVRTIYKIYDDHANRSYEVCLNQRGQYRCNCPLFPYLDTCAHVRKVALNQGSRENTNKTEETTTTSPTLNEQTQFSTYESPASKSTEVSPDSKNSSSTGNTLAIAFTGVLLVGMVSFASSLFDSKVNSETYSESSINTSSKAYKYMYKIGIIIAEVSLASDTARDQCSFLATRGLVNVGGIPQPLSYPLNMQVDSYIFKDDGFRGCIDGFKSWNSD